MFKAWLKLCSWLVTINDEFQKWKLPNTLSLVTCANARNENLPVYRSVTSRWSLQFVQFTLSAPQARVVSNWEIILFAFYEIDFSGFSPSSLANVFQGNFSYARVEQRFFPENILIDKRKSLVIKNDFYLNLSSWPDYEKHGNPRIPSSLPTSLHSGQLLSGSTANLLLNIVGEVALQDPHSRMLVVSNRMGRQLTRIASINGFWVWAGKFGVCVPSVDFRLAWIENKFLP